MNDIGKSGIPCRRGVVGACATGMKSALSVIIFWLSIVAFAFMAQTVSAADYRSGVNAIKLIQTTVTGNGQKIVYPSTVNPEVTAMMVEIIPGAETGWHSHPNPVYAYVVSGSLNVELEEGKTLSFKAGDAIIEVVKTPHNGKNIGSVPVRMVVFYTGVQGESTVIKAP